MAQVVLGGLGRGLAGPFGGLLGTTLGRALDNRAVASLQPARQVGPRLEALSLQSSADGAPMACVFGRARVTGQVIWAARFLERRNKRSGGKGGQKTVDYDYSLSFAVALGEGPIDGVGRVWADGQPLDLSGITMRVHRGTSDQQPDPLIEAVEGAAPAYRGTAYVVFEDLPLGAFGNRAPQLAFEVFRRVPGEGQMEDLIEGVCLIPGAGEFCLATQGVLRREGMTRTASENVNHLEGQTDLRVSLDQLMVQAPNLKRVSLVVGWFGDDVSAAECRVRPGVESRTKTTTPQTWKVAGLERAEAHLISQIDDGKGGTGPAYGGTPSDESVRQAIRALKAEGLEVTLYPFIFMDTEHYPWRGRITGRDGAQAATDVAAMFGSDTGWGMRRLALHYAQIVAEEGADGLLIGSEMRGLTWTRDADGEHPAVAELKALASECRDVVGPDTKLSYAADWSEYFGRQVDGEVRYHLDPLWADDNIDYVGIDWYAPLGDWREGDWRNGGGGIDARAGYRGASDAAYLATQVAGGEGYDWYYASDADRQAQTRTPIVDTAYGEDWVFRSKDLKSWWANAHYERPSGVKSASPTAWLPQMKPIRFTEFGCASVDRGGNAPNLFQDPKSSENALPPFSTGERDDRMQRRAIEAVLTHYGEGANNPVSEVYGEPMLEGADVWCWDARPFPAFPARSELWADAGAWSEGHWLNGRMVGDSADLIAAVLARGGLAPEDYATSGLEGQVSGYVIDRPMRVRDALEPLLTVFGVTAAERGGRIEVRDREALTLRLMTTALALPDEGGSLAAERRLTPRPETVRVRFINETADYQTGSVIVRSDGAAGGGGVDVDLPVVCDSSQATVVAQGLLADGIGDVVTVRLGPLEALKLEPGDAVDVEGVDGVWRVQRLDWDEQPTATLVPVVERVGLDGRPDWHPGDLPTVVGAPVLILMDLPSLADDDPGLPVVAVATEPWRPMTVHGGQGADDLTPRATVMQPATVGQLVHPLVRGVCGRWDEASVLTVRLEGQSPQTLSRTAVLAGGNALAIETTAGWEVVQYRRADLVEGDVWRLSGLLRGQQGTEAACEAGAGVGALVVVLDRDLPRVQMTASERGLPRVWRAGPAGMPPGGEAFTQADFTWTSVAASLEASAPEDKGRRGGLDDQLGAARPRQ